MQRWELHEGTTHKFLEARIEGAKIIMTEGKIGTEGRTRIRYFASKPSAFWHLTMIVSSRVHRKGWLEVKVPKRSKARARNEQRQAARLKKAKRVPARYFERANRFWEIAVAGQQQTIRSGRIGTPGRVTLRRFAYRVDAKNDAERLIGAKSRQGYVRKARPTSAASAASRRGGSSRR